jgi:hypothetical protein
MGSRIVRHLRGNVVGYVALVLALSGTAYALERNSVGDQALRPNSVGSSELEQNAVTNPNIRSSAVRAANLDPRSCGYTGQILLLGFGHYAPRGTLPANGAVLPTGNYQALASLYGNQFGGNGSTTFGLPDLAGPAPNLHYVVCTNGIFPEVP